MLDETDIGSDNRVVQSQSSINQSKITAQIRGNPLIVFPEAGFSRRKTANRASASTIKLLNKSSNNTMKTGHCIHNELYSPSKKLHPLARFLYC